MPNQKTAVLLILLLSTIAAFCAGPPEPLIGTWKLTGQTVNGQKVETDEMTLRIYTSGDSLEFAYSVPVNGVHFVSMTFTGVHLNGTAADVKDVRGNKVGTVKISKTGPSQYKAVIEGPNRPTASAKMTVSADGKTLTSESGSDIPGKGSTKTIQTFTRS